MIDDQHPMGEHSADESAEQSQAASVARDAMIGRSRIRGASRMIPDGTDPADVTKEQIAQVARDVETFMRGYGDKQKEIAQANGISGPTMSAFLKGTYAGNNAEIAIQLDDWMSSEEQRRQRPELAQFVWTNIAREIEATAMLALDFRKISLIYGKDTAGLGKTRTLQAIWQNLGPRRSALVTIDKVDASPTGLLRKLCAAMKVQDSNGGSNRQRFTRLVDELKGRSHLLMIDQIHNLRGAKDDKPFYILTDLYDATGSGQLWCGTSDLHVYLQKQRAKVCDESLAQIASRIFPQVDLMTCLKDEDGNGEPLVTVDQIREMFAKNKLKITPAAARFLFQIANTADSGCLRLCIQIMEFATMTAELKRLPSIDVPLLKESLRRAPHRVDVMLTKVPDEAPRQIARSA